MLYKDIQTWLARKTGKQDPHAQLGADHFADQKDRFWALKDLNFEVEQGDRVGIIGRNGAGKSTLLKILSRITAPTEGNVRIKGRVVSLLEVGTGFHPELTGRENIYLNGAILGMKKQAVASKLEEIVAFSEIEQFIDTPVKRYSSGMYVRLAFSVAAHLDADILLADEVLAVGDAAFQKKCLGKMEDVSASEGRTVIFVSHQMNFINQLCRNSILLSSGEISERGSTSKVIQRYFARSAREVASYVADVDNAQGADISIRRMTLVDSAGDPKASVEMKEPCIFEIDYDVRRNTRDAFIALHVFSGDQTLLIDSCDIDCHPDLLASRGPGTYRFRVGLPAQLLNAGRFYFEGWAGVPQRNLTFSKTPRVPFEVVDTGSSISQFNQSRECVLGLKLDWQND